MNEKVIAILEVFEDLLDSKGIEIPCEDEQEQKERYDGGNEAKIYGTEYGEVYDAIEKILKDDKDSLAVTLAMVTPMEALILSHLRGGMKHGVEFITPNEALLYNKDPKEVFYALDHLRELHILRKRNCAGTAYEFDPQFDWNKFTKRRMTSVNFTSEELTILSNALLRLISSTQEAVKLVNDLEIFEAIDKALNKYQRLNNKICDMESEISQEGEDET